MKKILTTLTLITGLLVSYSSFGAIATGTVAAGTNSVVDKASGVYQLVLANGHTTGGASVTATIFDAPTNTLTYTLAAYTNRTLSTISYTNAYTNVFGFVETNNYYTVVQPTQSVVAASTNGYSIVATFLVPAGESLVYSPSIPLVLSRGLCITNNATNTTFSYTITYAPVQ